MAQKTHPIGLRLGVSHTWDSSWYPNRDEGNHYSELLHKDLELRRLIQHFVEENHGLLLGSVHIQNAWVNQKDVSNETLKMPTKPLWCTFVFTL